MEDEKAISTTKKLFIDIPTHSSSKRQSLAYRRKSLFLFLLFWLSSYPILAQQYKTGVYLDVIAQACIEKINKDRICDMVVEVKQVGEDSIEAVKEYIHMGRYEYTALTLINFAATGRIRYKSKSFIYQKANHIYDYQHQKFVFSFEFQF